MALVKVEGLTKYFGGLAALQGVDLELESQEIKGLIGPNGAGKSTFLKVITGVYKPSAGRVRFNGEDITGLSPDRAAAKGIVRTFQETCLFGEMSVLENVLLGLHLSFKARWWQKLFNTSTALKEEKIITQRAIEILDFFGLAGFQHDQARNLAHGYQRMLGVAMALAANPKVLLLDEPFTGMNPEETSIMVKRIKRIRDELGIAVILVEHHMEAVMSLCDRIAVLNFGHKIAEGAPDEICNNPEVIKAYLGTDRVEVLGQCS